MNKWIKGLPTEPGDYILATSDYVFAAHLGDRARFLEFGEEMPISRRRLNYVVAHQPIDYPELPKQQEEASD